MACSANNIIKYVVYIEPGCIFKDDANNPTTEFSNIQNVYVINGINAFTTVNQRVPIHDIVSIGNEMTAGELNSIEVPVGDRKAKTTDGIRNLPDLDMVLKIDRSINPSSPTKTTIHFFADWWRNRNLWDFNFYIMITNKAYQHLYGYKYSGVTLAKFGTESISIEDVKKGQIQLKFYPDNAQLVDCNGDVIDSSSGSSLPTAFGVCAV